MGEPFRIFLNGETFSFNEKYSFGKNLSFVLKVHYQGIWLKIQLMIFSLNFKDHYSMNLRCSQSSK